MWKPRGISGKAPFILFFNLLGCGLAPLMCTPLDGAQVKSSYSVIYPFKGGADGSFPATGLAADTSGNLYGTTYFGGASGCGTLFEMSQSGGVWTETVLHPFKGGAGDGCNPVSDPHLTMRNGNLYGSTFQSGAHRYGTVFSFDPNTGTETVLYSFAGGSDGANPYAAPIFDTKGNLYGMTSGGGANGGGTVYKLAPNGTETVLWSFGAGNDGRFPDDGLVAYRGNFYGTCENGGTYGEGTVFEVTPGGVETVLYSFAAGNDGAVPATALIADKAGNLYGSTLEGGTHGGGTIFELAPDGSETLLYSFTGGSDGESPVSTLIRDNKNNFYGTTLFGGEGLGTVFKLTPNRTLKVLHSFKGGSDGARPFEGLTMDTNGNLYGATSAGDGCGGGGCGVVFGLTK